MLKEVQFFHEIDTSVNLANNASRAYASSKYQQGELSILKLYFTSP